MHFAHGHYTCTLSELAAELEHLKGEALHPSDLHVSIEMLTGIDAFLYGVDPGQQVVSVQAMGRIHIYVVTDTHSKTAIYFRTVAKYDFRSLCLSGTFWEDPSNQEEVWDCLQQPVRLEPKERRNG